MRIPDTHEPVRGFSLVELAIVIAIVMTLLTLGLGLMNAQLSSAASLITKKRQDAIKDALIAYLGANRRLPCPYVPTAGDPVTGIAPAIPCPQLGIVPFATLGLGREVSEDGWGNFFSYRVYADNPAPTCPVTGPAPGWDWGNANCFGEGKDGINPPKVALQINDGAGSSLANVVAVVISHGSNGLGAWAAQGTRSELPSAPACEEAYNAGVASPSGCTPAPNANILYKGERQENDDVVAYLTASEALQALVRQGTIKSAMAKVNDDLQTLADTAVAVKRSGIGISLLDGLITISGGCAASVETTDLTDVLSSMRDPWGGSYSVAPPSGSFPICIYSRGGGSTVCQQSTCTTATPVPPNPPAICRSIDRIPFNAYLVRAGASPGCP